MSIARLARWQALAAALVAVLVTAVPGSASAAVASPPGLTVSGVAIEDGQVRFALTGRGLAGAARLDPATVAVRLDGMELTSTATVAATAPADAPPRAVMVVLDATARVPAAQFEAARAAATSLAVALPGDVRLGLVTMTATVTSVAPTTNRAAFTAALAAVTRGGASTLSAAVLAGTAALRGPGLAAAPGAPPGPPPDRRLFLVSDGRDASARITEAARVDLYGDAIPVDVVAYAAGTTATARLREYSTPTGGRLQSAADRAGVVAAASSTAGAFPPVLVVTVTVPPELAGTKSTLDVTVGSAGVSVAQVVTFAGRPAAPAPPVRAAGEGWLAFVFAAVLFVALVALALVLGWPRGLPNQRIRQIAHFGPGRTRTVPRMGSGSAAHAVRRGVLDATASMLRRVRLTERISLRLERAGVRRQPHEWVLLRALATMVGGIGGWVVLGRPGAGSGLALGWLVTTAYLTVRVRRRASRFADQLPGALQLVIGSLRSGFSLAQALDLLAREAPDPVGAEFGRALTEHRLGADLPDALQRVAVRTGSEELSWAVMVVRIQREIGGDLVEVLQTTVDTLRERGRLRGHVRSLSARRRRSAGVLIAAPLALGLFMLVLRPTYMAPLVTEPIGLTMLAGAGLLFVAGTFWLSRVIRVEA